MVYTWGWTGLIEGMITHFSGTGVNISSSSRNSSSSVFVLAISSAVLGGSHDAMRRWLRARATFALLKTISASDVEIDILKLLADAYNNVS